MVVELDGTPIGRLITDVQPDSIYFVDIIISAYQEGSGIGSALLLAVFDEARQRGINATSKVLNTNVASLRMCGKMGFTVVNEDPAFVNLLWRPSDRAR